MIRTFLLTCFLMIVGASSAYAQGMLLPVPCDTPNGRCIPAPQPIPLPRPIPTPRPAPSAPFELRSYDVEVEIVEDSAHTKVTHVFYNPGAVDAEGVFYFPVPAGATTTNFALWMNGQRVEGSVLPRDRARQIYEGIVRSMRDPGLLEYVNSELFQASIYPIPARGEQRVEIEYATPLSAKNGATHFRLPVDARVAREGVKVSIQGTIQSRTPILRVYAPHEALEIIQDSSERASFGFEGDGATLGDQMEVFIAKSEEELAYSLITWPGEGDEDNGYFMLSLSPGKSVDALQRLPKQITFVLDTSGSMRGQKWEQSTAALRQGLDALHEGDLFNIVVFSGAVRTAFDAPLRANARGVQRGKDFIDQQHPTGGTNISDALLAAIAQPEERGRPHSVLFLTDGVPTSGVRAVPELLTLATRSLEADGRRLFVFGVGYDVNTNLLDGMAEAGRGRSDYVRPEEDVREKVGGVMHRIGSPLLTNPQLTITGVTVTDMYPRVLPDIYEGESVTVFGRYRGTGRATIRVQALAGQERVQREWRARFADAASERYRFVGNLWARRRVAELFRQHNTEPSDAVREEITELGVRWNLVTPFTSYLSVEPGHPMAPSPPARHMGVRAASPVAESASAPMMMMDGGGASSVGRGAVERSIARREMEDADQLSSSRAGEAQTRMIAGRTFDLSDGVWVERGLRGGRERTITYLSDAWFELQRTDATLRAILSLGEEVRFEHGGAVIRVVP